jgi:CxxC motif-containing protein (DUF1111 family)
MIRAARSWWLAPVVFLLAGAGDAPTPAEAQIERGRVAFEQLWSVAPSAFGRWGRGPLSNGAACTECHDDHDRGEIPADGGPVHTAVLQLSIAGVDSDGRPRPHPVYGRQLQHEGILGRVPPEGEVHVVWETHTHRHPDGTTTTLRSPRVVLEHLAHGPIADDVMRSLRAAPALRGVGLLEAIPEALILGRAADGGGRVNRVPDGAGGWTVGRFGHKAAQADLRGQVLMAMHEDLGVTSGRFPAPNCSAVQAACRAEPLPPVPEAGDGMIDDLVAYLRQVPPPARGAHEDRGAHLFEAVGCTACHVPSWTWTDATGTPRTIAPYTDLLLHDLGAGLADGRPELAAGPSEWRTAPLWGVGRATNLLHDGRARSPEEAILWHDGAAANARARFEALGHADRAALLQFLASLR